MHVLIGVDGSRGSFAALESVAAWLGGRDEITLYYAPPEIRIESAADPRLVQRARDAVVSAVLDEAKARLPESVRGNVKSIIGTQKPARGLLLAADQLRADLIVVGARGERSLASLVLGSASREIVYGAKVPVLIVRESPHRAAGGPRVLIAHDGSPVAGQIAGVLSRFTWPATTSASVLGVVEPILVGDVPDWLARKVRSPEIESMTKIWDQERVAEQQTRQNELQVYCRQLPPPLDRASVLVEEGNAADHILAAADSQRADLLVIGARGEGAWERLLLGSTAARLVGQAPCSVLVVHRYEAP